MRWWWIGGPAAVAASLLAGGAIYAGMADSEQIARCERLLISQIRTPATYERVEAGEEDQYVMIWFDAQNTSGATVRGQMTCTFEDGRIAAATLDGDLVRESILSLY